MKGNPPMVLSWERVCPVKLTPTTPPARAGVAGMQNHPRPQVAAKIAEPTTDGATTLPRITRPPRPPARRTRLSPRKLRLNLAPGGFRGERQKKPLGATDFVNLTV